VTASRRPVDAELAKRLTKFAKTERFIGKGPLCVALVTVQHARNFGLPLDPEKLLTDSKGQVQGLGRGAVQQVLKRHGIEKVLASEGGRTSRGSIDNMRKFVGFLNQLESDGIADLDAIEHLLIQRVREFFAAKPFVLDLDQSKSVRSAVHELLEQAIARQTENPGTNYQGTVLQHLVGAKLSLLVDGVEHHGASVADESRLRPGDFLINDVAIHVTTAPNEALVSRCLKNLGRNLRPMIITPSLRMNQVAESLCEQAGIDERVEILEAEQFLTGNVYELGKFDPAGRLETVRKLIDKYNSVVKEHETDSSLAIDVP